MKKTVEGEKIGDGLEFGRKYSHALLHLCSGGYPLLGRMTSIQSEQGGHVFHFQISSLFRCMRADNIQIGKQEGSLYPRRCEKRAVLNSEPSDR